MKKNSKYLILIVIAFLISIISCYKNMPTNDVLDSSALKISYLDVGQADSILIECDNKYMLIDAGNTEDGPKLVNYFKNNNINEFTYVVGTHAHEDHIGGMSDIINNFKIDDFYMPDVITTTKTFEDTLDALNNNNIKFQTPKIGDKLYLGSATLNVLYVGTDNKDLNNSSIVLKLSYGNNKFLFMGDATTSVEKEILTDDLASDVLKVGHHGSKTSSSKEFLSKVNPKYAIISVGLNNTYNLPSSSTLTKLNSLNTKIYRTDEDGTIVVTSDTNNISINNIKTDTNGG